MARCIYSIFKVNYGVRGSHCRRRSIGRCSRRLSPINASLAFAVAFVLLWYGCSACCIGAESSEGARTRAVLVLTHRASRGGRRSPRYDRAWRRCTERALPPRSLAMHSSLFAHLARGAVIVRRRRPADDVGRRVLLAGRAPLPVAAGARSSADRGARRGAATHLATRDTRSRCAGRVQRLDIASRHGRPPGDLAGMIATHVAGSSA
jgi:hypothetical protein